MTREEAAKIINRRHCGNTFCTGDCSAGVENCEYGMAIEALRQTADKDCSQCKDKGRCAIHDNFNIDYCSDWRLP